MSQPDGPEGLSEPSTAERVRVDLHSHILPGVDDGAANIDQSLAMAERAVADGTAAMVATPHAGLEGKSASREAIVAAHAALQESLQQRGISLQVHLAAEVYFAPDLVAQVKRDPWLTIGGAGKYLLTELPMYSYPTYVAEICFQLLLAGVVPILAHPERNLVLQRHPRRLYELVTQGVMAQVDAESLTGRFGSAAQAAGRSFLRHGLIHFLGSDAHGVEQRPPLLAEAAAIVEEEVGAEQAWQITVAWPRQVLAGGYVDPGGATLPRHGEIASREHRHGWARWRSWLPWGRAF
ncbi:MAG: hypothetical protein IMX01_05370 [Limnochordaceae bacterium]|nr:hypothetical protein [Limnochordaceae bacterium]